MSDFSAIVDHPDSEEIVSKLLGGSDPENVAQWLKIRYPNKDQAYLHLSVSLLRSFKASGYQAVKSQFQKDVAAVKAGEKVDKKLAKTLIKGKFYQDVVADYVDQKFDIEKEMMDLIKIARFRIEQVFDKIQMNPDRVGKAEFSLIKWLETLMGMIEKYQKVKNGGADQVVQHNVTFQYLDDYSSIFQDAIRETFNEVDPNLTLKFMDIFQRKMVNLNPPSPGKEPNTNNLSRQINSMKDNIAKQLNSSNEVEFSEVDGDNE